MPLYEYRCAGCGHRVTIFVQGLSPPAAPVCPDCGGMSLTRLFSTFAVRKSDKAVYEDILSDGQLVKGLEHSDPRALAEWNKRMSHGLEQETAPEYEDMLEKMEAGEMPAPPQESP
ncbi:MAG: zinc ribbon domain-containing protein [Chloroflexi bacterium]|nr:zinc ribbon domain-containing protein [Chloroflexota bacterium]